MPAAWLVARVPGHDAATVARAHAAAGRAAEVLGSTWRAQRSVAMAAYRAGEFRACLEAVERSLERQGAGRPELHAIAALALHGLGDPAAAERLERAEALLASPSWRHDPEAGPIVAEAARMLR